MRTFLRNVTAAVVVSVLVVVINIALFSLFPYLHRVFAENVAAAITARPTRTVLSYRKPEEKKEVRKVPQVRQVSNTRRSGGNSSLQFKFTPDLSVEGTQSVAMEQQELAAVIFEEGETDEPAIPLFQPPIPYPDRARDLEIEGVLEVIIIIDTRGKVSSVEVVRSPHASIANAARKVIDTWRFKPARNKGVPVRMRVRQVIEFTLE